MSILSYSMRPNLSRTIIYLILRDLLIMKRNKNLLLNSLLFCLSYLFIWYFIIGNEENSSIILAFILSVTITFSMLLSESYTIASDYNNGNLEMLLHTSQPFHYIITYKFIFYLLSQLIISVTTLFLTSFLFEINVLNMTISVILFVLLIASNLFLFFAMTLSSESKILVSLLLIPLNLPYTLLFLLSLNDPHYLALMLGISIVFTPILIYSSNLMIKEAIVNR